MNTGRGLLSPMRITRLMLASPGHRPNLQRTMGWPGIFSGRLSMVGTSGAFAPPAGSTEGNSRARNSAKSEARGTSTAFPWFDSYRGRLTGGSATRRCACRLGSVHGIVVLVADRSSRMDLVKNADDSVDLYMGPRLPKDSRRTGFRPSPAEVGSNCSASMRRPRHTLTRAGRCRPSSR